MFFFLQNDINSKDSSGLFCRSDSNGEGLKGTFITWGTLKAFTATEYLSADRLLEAALWKQKNKPSLLQCKSVEAAFIRQVIVKEEGRNS